MKTINVGQGPSGASPVRSSADARKSIAQAVRFEACTYSIIAALALSACATNPQLSPEQMKALADASAGCVNVTGAAGSVRVVYVGTDKGAVRNATVSIKGDCSEIIVTANQPVPKP